MSMENFIRYAQHQHDIECNQRYATSFMGGIPYSFHLKAVVAQAKRFGYLLRNDDERRLTEMGGWGHDLIEDARVTYNDIRNNWGQTLADIIFACTELRGRDRSERHGAEYFETLKANRLAVFVKLCDIIANVTFSMLTGSSMYDKYRKEYPHMCAELKEHAAEFMPMFLHLEHLLEINK
jgi:(p)ppGpp synthase/HD superfamily hydrolase